MRIFAIILVIILLAGSATLWLLDKYNLINLPQGVTQTAIPSSPASQQKNIEVFSPQPNDKVESPIVVKGRARVFENSFAFALKDQNGSKLYENHGMAGAADIGLFGDFEVRIPVSAGSPRSLIVEVFNYSAKDGSVENLVSIPVELVTQETMKVKIYYSNDKLDPAITCIKVFPVERTILKTREVAFMSLFELLKGPSPTDKSRGYASSIPENVRINSIRIENARAFVDFDYALDFEVAGSCRVLAIRSQITNTLKQFPTVSDVVISINGRTEDILQP